MKCIVKPSTPHMLVLDFGEVVHPTRPSVVTYTAYVQSRVASGQLTLVAAKIDDSMTDDQFRKFFRESNGDEELAVQSFQSAQPRVETEEPQVPPVEKPEVPAAVAPPAAPTKKK